MYFYYLIFTLIISLFPISMTAAEDLMDPVIVTATKVKTKDTKATYASEIYYRKDIELSGAKSVIDFLNQNTSVVIMSNSGNRYEPKVDMRGFGITEGYKNLVITLNGRRMNTIESSPQSLGSIPINNIERIEITKGSGSVMFGDGAQSGSIQLYTRDTTETTLEGSAGNYGQQNQAFSTGLSEEKYIISASGLHSGNTGTADEDVAGDSDYSDIRSYQFKLKYFPTESVELYFEKDSSTLKIKYPNQLIIETWMQNPGSSYKSTSTGPTEFFRLHQDINNWTLGGIKEFGNKFKVTLEYSHQDRERSSSDTTQPAVATGHTHYHNNIINAGIDYKYGPYRVLTGVNTFDGTREYEGTAAKKSNLGVYAQGYYDIDDTTVLSLGARREGVEYHFNNGPNVIKKNNFWAYDIGINKSINEHLSIFSNFNSSFLSPDLDRMYGWNVPAFTKVDFNPWIEPSTAKTINIGLNHVTPTNKLKLTLFNIKSRKELWMVAHNDGTNTNLDKSQKYGLELQDTFNYNSALSVSANYAWTRAIVLSAPGGFGSKIKCLNRCSGNTMPGVPEHTIVLGINYAPTSASRIVLTQNFRSEAYNEEDLENDDNVKQREFTSTDLSYTHTLKTESGKGLLKGWANGPRHIEFVAKIENLFEQANGVYLKDGLTFGGAPVTAIFPDLYTRNWTLGAKLKF